MIRLILFFLLILALGWGFAWVADRPGIVELTWQGEVHKTSLMVVLTAIIALIAAIMILWSIIRAIIQAPGLLGRFFRNRRRDRGYDALSQGLIAASAGDAALARRHARESMKLLRNEPLVDLLDTQTALLEGKDDKARGQLERMLESDKTKLVALRGLYLEAQKHEEPEAARHYAQKAHEASPALPWAANAMLKYRSMDQDWQAALTSLESNRSAGLIDKVKARRKRAVLLTALAQKEEPASPEDAARHAREALKLAPDLVPAAIIGARAYMRNNDLSKAAGMLAAVWKKEPHPEIADAYVNLRIGDAAADRLKRAQKLASMRQHHPEGNLALAEAAIDAKQWKIARDAIKPVLTNNLSQRACLVMADLEEGEFGDKGKMRDWLSRAVRAPKNAAWTADGYVSEEWLPISPVTGEVDAFEWKVPLEQLGQSAPLTLEASELEEAMASSASPVSPSASSPLVKPASSKPKKGASGGLFGAVAGAIAGAGAGASAMFSGSSDSKDSNSADSGDDKKVDESNNNKSASKSDEPADAGADKEAANVVDENAQEVKSDKADKSAIEDAEIIEAEPVKPETQKAGDDDQVNKKDDKKEETKKPAENGADTDSNVAKGKEATDKSTGRQADKPADQSIDKSANSSESDAASHNVDGGKPILDRRPDDPGVRENAQTEAERKKILGIF